MEFRWKTISPNIFFPLALLFGLWISSATFAAPGIDEASPEIWIDGPDAVQPGNDRRNPDVAVDELGRRIHVWETFGAVERSDIFLRIFDAAGNPLEDPRQVNTTTEDDQWEPAVAVSADGSFLVVFQSDEFDSVEGGDRRAVRSQAYDSNGDALGTEQLLNTVTSGTVTTLYADVAALRTSDGSPGGYIVVWKSRQSAGTDDNDSIEGCLVSAIGVPGAQFQVNSNDDPNQDRPSVTELVDGGFLATWTADSQIVGRRFNSAGGPIGNEFVISSSFVAQKLDNDAAIGWDGRVLVVWADQEDNGGIDQREIYARLYDADLNALGPDFRVNTVTLEDQSDPRVADLGPEGLLVVWESQVASGADLGVSIESRLVVGPNQFGGPQTQVNIWDNDNPQNFPAAHGWYGRAAIDWRTLSLGIEPIPVPNTDDHIVGRDIEHCLFCDDFEWFSPASSGNLWRWSNSQGVVPRPDVTGTD